MKSHIIKGIISAVVTFILFLVMSLILTILIEKQIFVYDSLDMFPPNLFGVIVLVVSLLIPVAFCKFKKFVELLIFSVIYYFSVRILYVVTFGGLYVMIFTLDRYAIDFPIVFSNNFWDATFYNLVYIPVGIIIGFIFSIVVNIIRNIMEKKNIKADDNT